MTEFLSQNEIDALLDVPMYESEFPLFLYLKKPDDHYGVLEVSYQQAKKMCTSVESDKFNVHDDGVYQHKLENALEKKKYKIIQTFESKGKLVRFIQSKFDKFSELEKEVKFMRYYMNKYPEYVL